LPATSDEVDNVAVPPVNVAVPNVVAESKNVTVPLGVPVPAVTVAVKVTDWPNTDGLSELVTVVEVEPWLTVCVIAAEVLAVKLPSPP
jgi:hypothetical protein